MSCSPESKPRSDGSGTLSARATGTGKSHSFSESVPAASGKSAGRERQADQGGFTTWWTRHWYRVIIPLLALTVFTPAANSESIFSKIANFFSPKLSISPKSLSGGKVGIPYAQQLSAAGSKGRVTWSLSGGSTWLSISASGLLSGTPTYCPAEDVTVTATDNKGSASANYVLSIDPSEPLRIVTDSIPPMQVGVPVNFKLEAVGGCGGH